jgi:hypothetical protein
VHRAEGPIQAQLPGGELIVPAPPTSRFEGILRQQLPMQPGTPMERRGGTYVPARAAAPAGKRRKGKGKGKAA